MKGHGKAKEGGWPPKDKVGANLLKSLNSSSYLRGVSTPNYHFFSRRNCVRRSSYNTREFSANSRPRSIVGLPPIPNWNHVECNMRTTAKDSKRGSSISLQPEVSTSKICNPRALQIIHRTEALMAEAQEKQDHANQPI